MYVHYYRNYSYMMVSGFSIAADCPTLYVIYFTVHRSSPILSAENRSATLVLGRKVAKNAPNTPFPPTFSGESPNPASNEEGPLMC